MDRLPARGLDAPAAAGPATLGLTRVAARLDLPVVVRGRGRTVLLQALFAERYGLGYGGSDASGLLPAALYRIGYAGLLSRQLGGGPWRIAAGAQVTLAGDLEDVGTDQLQVTGQLLATRRASRSLEWGVGVAWINVGPGLVPALLLRWQDGGRQRLEVIPPVRVEYARALGPRVEAGLAGRLLGGRFRRGSALAAGAERVDLVELVAGPWASVRVGPVTLRGDAGYAPLRRYRLREGEGNAEVRTLDARSGAWFRLGAAVRF